VASSQAVALLAMLVDLVVSRRRAFVLRPSFRFAALWMVALPLAYVVADIQVLSRYLLLLTPAVCAGGWMSLQTMWQAPLGRLQTAVLSCALVVALAINGVVYAFVVIPPSRAFSEDLQVNMAGLPDTCTITRNPGTWWRPRTSVTWRFTPAAACSIWAAG
jgi:hypothetical protein